MNLETFVKSIKSNESVSIDKGHLDNEIKVTYTVRGKELVHRCAYGVVLNVMCGLGFEHELVYKLKKAQSETRESTVV